VLFREGNRRQAALWLLHRHGQARNSLRSSNFRLCVPLLAVLFWLFHRTSPLSGGGNFNLSSTVAQPGVVTVCVVNYAPFVMNINCTAPCNTQSHAAAAHDVRSRQRRAWRL